MKRRKWKIAIALVGLLLLAVALAPTLLSGVVGRRVVAAIAPRVEGSVSIGSTSLGWLSPQRISGLSIDGGGDIGSVRVDVEVAEGLIALATGSDISVTLAGSASSAFDAEGRLGLARLAKPSDAPAPQAGSPAAPASGGSPLGTRSLRLRLDGIDLAATGPDGSSYAITGIRGDLALGADGAIEADLAGATRSRGRDGSFTLAADAKAVFGPQGSLDLAATTAAATIDAKGVAWPTAAGELEVATLALAFDKAADRSLRLDAQVDAGIAGSTRFDASVEVALARAFGADGGFAFDPTALVANIEARNVPVAAFAPFAPELRPGVRLDLARDLGERADLRISHDGASRSRAELATPKVNLVFEASIVPDGPRIESGELALRATVEPQLLEAFGVRAESPMLAVVGGRDLAWSRGGDALAALGGDFSVEIAEPFRFMPAEGVSATLSTLRATAAKKAGQSTLAATATAEGAYGAAGTLAVSARGTADLSKGALSGGALDANLGLDGATLERLSQGAVASRGEAAALKVSIPSLAFTPADGRAALDALAVTGRIELGGALALDAGETEAMVNDLAVSFTLPGPDSASRGSLELGATIDGARARVEQRFRTIPRSFDGIAGPGLVDSGLEGSIELGGIDPALIARLAPAAKDAVALLGRGASTLSVRNSVEGGAFVATVGLAAPSMTVDASMRATKDEILLAPIVVRTTLSAESARSLRLPDSVELAPGTAVALRVSELRLARGAEGFAPAGEVAARVEIDSIRLMRAPGLSAPLAIARIESDASWSFAASRATAKGSIALGDGAGGGTYTLSWVRVDEAKVFGGLGGALAFDALDLARLEGAFGAERGAWSGYAGGPGSLRVTLTEAARAEAVVALDFPALDAAFRVDFDSVAEGLLARVALDADATLSPERFARLAGLADDPRRRVVTPVRIAVKSATCAVPLREGFAPDLARVAVDARATVSPIAIEVTDAAGARTTISTGALEAQVRATALAEEIVVTAATAPAQEPEVGALQLEAKARGAVARGPEAKAAPVIDATVRATRYPAAAVDALAGSGGAVRKYLGDSVDVALDARGLDPAKGAGSLSARVASPYASLEAPSVVLSEGFLRVRAEAPLVASLAMSPAVREELLSSIHPVFSDVTAAQPARFTVSSLDWPLDGRKARLDARARLEVGEVRLTNSGPLGTLLGVLGGQRTDGFEALVEPLDIAIAKGRLTYRDFALRAGRMASGAWKNSLLFAGDIDLGAAVPYARSITTTVPLSDVARWSSDARRVFDQIALAAPELAKALTVGVDLSGPLFDAQGKPARLKEQLKLPDIGDVLRDNPGSIIDAAGGIFDALRRKKDGAKP